MREANPIKKTTVSPVSNRWLPLFLCIIILGLAACGPSPDENARRKADGIPDQKSLPFLLYAIKGVASLPAGADGTGTHVFCAGTSYSAYTDAKGNYTISSVPPGHYALVAQRPNYENQAICEVTLAPTRPINALPEFTAPSVQLRPAVNTGQFVPGASPRSVSDLGTITGKAALSDGITPELIRVSLKGTQFSTTTDRTGQFSIMNVEPGKYEVNFSRPGYDDDATTAIIQRNHTTVLSGTTILKSSSSRGIIGRILFTDTKDRPIPPVKGASIRVVELDKTVPVETDGTFAITGLPPGTYTVTAAAPDFTLRDQARVDVQTGVNPIVLTLTQLHPSAGEITGIALLEGAPSPPLAGTQVSLAGTSYSGTTDDDGRFNLTGIPEGSYSLVLTHEKYETLQNDTDVNSGETTDVGTLTMKKSVIPPKVLSNTPADGERDLLIIPVVIATVQFSKPMNADSIRAAFSITPVTTFNLRVIAGKSGGGQDLLEISLPNSVSPNSLHFNTTYRIHISDSAQDIEGNNLEDPFSFSFTTGGLRILSTLPDMNETNVVPQSAIPLIVRFNGRVDPDTLIDRNIKIEPRPYSMPTLRPIQYQRQTGWTELTMPVSWNANVEYTVTFSRSIRAIDGTPLDKTPYRLKFRSARLPQPANVPVPTQ